MTGERASALHANDSRATTPQGYFPAKSRQGWPGSIIFPCATLLLLGLLVATPATAFPPATNYATQCQGCHRANGEATGDIVPRINGVVGAILDRPGGREYLVRVPGVAQSQLDDRELTELLNWLVGRFGGDAASSSAPFEIAEVAGFRRNPLIELTAARVRLFATAAPPGDAAAFLRAPH